MLLVVHGLAEHGGRYAAFARRFASRGYAVFSFDLRGHGESEGRPGYVHRFSDYLDDLQAAHQRVRELDPATPCVLVGHSVGGLIAASYATVRGTDFTGLILSAPTLRAGSSVTPMKLVAARALSLVVPGMGISAIDASGLSRDRRVIEAYVNDPLVFHGKISARLGSELIKAMRRLPPNLPGIRLPLLILHGTADRLSNLDGSVMLHESAGSEDKTLIRYDGLYHEVFNEPEADRVMADVEGWLAGRLGKAHRG